MSGQRKLLFGNKCFKKKKKPGKEGEGKDKGRKQTREVIHELGEKRPQ
jgi:hypothetical protein